MTTTRKLAEGAFQNHYDDVVSHCYGCGRLNEKGLHIKSYWEGDEAVCYFEPLPYHTAIPGFVYGGLIASIIDCHSTGTAAAAAYRAENRSMETLPRHRYVTASLHVDYLKPTPIDKPLVCRAEVRSFGERKVVVSSRLFAGEVLCARGEAVLAPMPKRWLSNID